MSQTAPARVTAAMLVIGDEILSGRTRDINIQTTAKRLGEIGVTLKEARVISDDPTAIQQAVKALAATYDYVFTSGGIGPTHDDITSENVAAAFGAHIDVRPDARALLEDYYGDNINPARLRMARIPDGAILIDNPISRAPGFQLNNVFVMAGVPDIFGVMLENALPRLKGGARIWSWSFTASVPEGEVTRELAELDGAHAHVSFGSYPFHRGGLGVTLVARSADRAALEVAAGELRAMMMLKTAELKEAPPED